MALNQNIRHPAFAQLGDILTREISAATTLLHLLHKECKLLQHNNFSELAATANEKEIEISTLNALAREQGSLLQKLGISDDEDCTIHRLFAPPGMRELRMQWEALIELLHDCQRQNQINGQALELGRQHNSRALALLFGDRNTDSTYSRNGSRSSIAPSRYTALA